MLIGLILITPLFICLMLYPLFVPILDRILKAIYHNI